MLKAALVLKDGRDNAITSYNSDGPWKDGDKYKYLLFAGILRWFSSL